MAMIFPKIIHQIWYQGQNKIPEDLKENCRKIKNLHPKWEHILWDDDRIQTFFKESNSILTTYNNLEFLHQKVDFIRYCILYTMGGIYLDTDITMLKTLDTLNTSNLLKPEFDIVMSGVHINAIESYFLCGYSECINNAVIIAKPKSKFLKVLINEITENKGQCKWYEPTISYTINRTTGPMMVTRMYNTMLSPEIKIKIHLLHWSYFEPCTLGDLCDIRDNTIAIHHHHTSWVSKHITNVIYFYFKYKFAVVLTLMIILVSIFYKLVNIIKY